MGCAESVHFYGPLLCHKRLCQHGRVADESDGTDIYSRQGGNTKDKTVSSRGPDLSEASDDEAVIEEVLPHSINASADYGDGRVMESSEVWSQPLQRRNFLPPLGPRLGPPVGMTSFSPPLRRPKTGHPKGQSPAAPGSPSKLAQPGQSPVNVKVTRQLTQLGEDEAEVNEKVEAESEAEAEAEDGAKAEDDGKPREDLDKNSNHEDGGQKEAPPEKDGAKVASEQGSGGPSGSPVMDALA